MSKPDLERISQRVDSVFKSDSQPARRLRFLDEPESRIPAHSVHYIVQASVYALALYGLYSLFF